MTDWKDNPYQTYRRLPDDVAEDWDNVGSSDPWKRDTIKVDVMTSGGHIFNGIDPILAFMGPDVVTKYRYPAVDKESE